MAGREAELRRDTTLLDVKAYCHRGIRIRVDYPHIMAAQRSNNSPKQISTSISTIFPYFLPRVSDIQHFPVLSGHYPTLAEGG